MITQLTFNNGKIFNSNYEKNVSFILMYQKVTSKYSLIILNKQLGSELYIKKGISAKIRKRKTHLKFACEQNWY